MSNEKSPGYVSRSTYWLYYMGIMVITWAMSGWGVYEYVTLHLLPIVFGFVAPSILAVYFRLIAMQRCRDIGWPAYLPWLTIGLIVGSGVMAGLRAGFDPASAIGSMGVSMVLGMILGLVDFVFLIVIGCIAGTKSSPSAAADADRYEPLQAQGSRPNYIAPRQRAPTAPGVR